MNKNILYILLTLFLICAVPVACTSKNDADTDKGAIDKMTDKAAKGMADSIQIPLQRAQAAAKIQEDKMRDLEEAMKDK